MDRFQITGGASPSFITATSGKNQHAKDGYVRKSAWYRRVVPVSGTVNGTPNQIVQLDKSSLISYIRAQEKLQGKKPTITNGLWGIGASSKSDVYKAFNNLHSNAQPQKSEKKPEKIEVENPENKGIYAPGERKALETLFGKNIDEIPDYADPQGIELNSYNDAKGKMQADIEKGMTSIGEQLPFFLLKLPGNNNTIIRIRQIPPTPTGLNKKWDIELLAAGARPQRLLEEMDLLFTNDFERVKECLESYIKEK